MIRNTLLCFLSKDSHLADLAKDSHLAEGSHLATPFIPALPILLGKLGKVLFLLVAAGFLLIALTACAGGAGGSSGNGASSADTDNDGIENDRDNCPLVANPQQTNTDNATDGGDACDDDDDNDGLNDNDPREQQKNSDDMSCSLLEDCDNDTIRDIDEVVANCVIRADCDEDGEMDVTDIDDDGDGLIEIGTAEELNAVRYALNGSGRRSLRNGVLNTDGCGNGNDITSCSGYELVKDISLAAYANTEGGKGWQPLGNDTDSDSPGCQGAAFNGIFEGNGWTISELSINRSAEDCVGLFGHIIENSEIRNLTLRAEAVIGGNQVGGLVGFGQSARIVSFSVVVGEISGDGNVGGLVGSGLSAEIHSSSVVADVVSGTGQNIGGLIGNDMSGRIHSSSVVVGVVSGTNNHVGGLVGQSQGGRIYSSSVVAGVVRGENTIGSLVGRLRSGRIHSSSAVVGEASGGTQVGGLIGLFAISSYLAYSYVVSGSNTNMLAGIVSGTGVASYWDNETSGFTSGGNLGTPKTSNELRSPTDYEGIYDDWDKTNIFGGDEPLAVWCDRDNSGSIEAGEKIDANLIWDFGESDEYPAIRCTPISPTEWRDWWFLNASDKPELDQDRLDEALNP